MTSRMLGRVGAALVATVALTGAALTAQTPAQITAPTIVVYKTPTCGCCQKWVEHLQGNGLKVLTQHRDDLSPLRAQHGVPASLTSCHTALVGSYVVEGHVPAADVKRLLSEKPAIKGIAVAGMPIGSPGMEGGTPQKFDTVAFTADGKTTVFARH